MPVDPLAVATVGFQSAGTPVSFPLCIATEGYQCIPIPAVPRGKGGGGWCPVPDPRDECDYIEPAELARVAFEALADWKCDADAEARNLAATAGLALCGDDSEGAALAVMAALLLEEDS